MSAEIVTIGAEGEPVACLDACLEAPQELTRLAESLSFAAVSPYYPGVRAAVPKALYPALFAPFGAIIRSAFGYGAGATVRECNFSLVTTRPQDLAPIQRMPHYDGLDPNVLAVLIYLCGPEHGGTAFFRHRRTGFETVTQDRFQTYRDALAQDVNETGLPPARYCEEDERFERIALFDAAFNRALIYRGVTLHSSAIAEGATYAPDPRLGRLTVNAFIAPA